MTLSLLGKRHVGWSLEWWRELYGGSGEFLLTCIVCPIGVAVLPRGTDGLLDRSRRLGMEEKGSKGNENGRHAKTAKKARDEAGFSHGVRVTSGIQLACTKRQSAEGYLSFLPVCPPRPSNASTGSYTSAGGTHKIRGLSFSLRVKTRSCHCAGGETRCILAASLEGKGEDSGSEPRRRRGWQRHPPA